MQKKLLFLILTILVLSFGCISSQGSVTEGPIQHTGPRPINENCISWFDGCNYCHISDGETICTEAFCTPEEMFEPFCEEYKN